MNKWYIFALLLIGVGAFAALTGHHKDGYELIALGSVISVILALTGGNRE